MPRLTLFAFSAAACWSTPALASAGWQLIASDIGGSPLGVSCFEDGLTCVTSVSQLLPAGYEALQSTDGGYTFQSVPDQDLFIFGLFNNAVFDTHAVLSGESFIQYSNNKGLNYSAADGGQGGPAGGEIVRLLHDTNGKPSGFAIMGLVDSSSTNGVVTSEDGGATWEQHNIPILGNELIATDGVFFADTWLVVAEEYITSLASSSRRPRNRRAPTHKLRWGTGGALERTPREELGKAAYAMQVVKSTDGGVSWATLYQNASVAALGMACLDEQHCCIAGEDAQFAYLHCTRDGFKTTRETFADLTSGAALVEIGVWRGPANDTCYVAVGGYVTDFGQSPVYYRSCDKGATWALDAANISVAGLLVTDIDCQSGAPNGTMCTTTLWDSDGLDPNGYVARYFTA